MALVFEDTEKVKDHKWVNRGKEGTHGNFTTKKAADAQRKAMFANGYHEAVEAETVEKMTPYMLRNDGKLLTCGEIHPYVKMFYKDDFEVNLQKLEENIGFLKWFYLNTLLEETKAMIINLLVLMNSENAVKVLEDLGINEKPEALDDDTETVFNNLNNATNQEFCRVRTSNFKYKYGGDNGEIYFRISSKNFDWYNLIWTTVYQFKNSIKYVTVMYDYAVFGKQFDYINNYNKVPVEEFLTESGNPVIEDLNEAIIKVDQNDITPSDEDIEFIARAYNNFAPHAGSNREDKDFKKWQREKWIDDIDNFWTCPWGIAWKLYNNKDMQKALKYYITAVALGWDDLTKQLTRTLKDTWKLTSKQFSEISAKWSENLADICNRVKKVVYGLNESLREDVEKHDTLNPKLWNEDNTLKDEVKEKINQIVDEFVEKLKEDEITINVKDIVLVGSNCSYNYTDESDLDVHIIAEDIQCPEELYSKVYSAYRSIFNDKLDIDFYGIPVELYVETEGMPRVSNGCYSVMNDAWVNEPVAADIPEINQDELDKELQTWEDRYNKIVDNSEEKLEEVLNKNTLNEVLRNINKMEIIVSILNYVTGNDYSYLLEKESSIGGKRLVPKYILHHADSNHENNVLDNLYVLNRNDHQKYHRGLISWDEIEKIDISNILTSFLKDSSKEQLDEATKAYDFWEMLEYSLKLGAAAAMEKSGIEVDSLQNISFVPGTKSDPTEYPVPWMYKDKVYSFKGLTDTELRMLPKRNRDTIKAAKEAGTLVEVDELAESEKMNLFAEIM